MSTTTEKPLRIPTDPLGAMAVTLSKHLETMSTVDMQTSLSSALREMLNGTNEDARSLRTALQIYLAKASNQSSTEQTAPEEMLSTEEAARLMGRSRPWVAMLIDAQGLAGATTTSGGHRKVPRTSVMTWIKKNQATAVVSSNYRLAGADAKIYAVDDATYVKKKNRLKKRG